MPNITNIVKVNVTAPKEKKKKRRARKPRGVPKLAHSSGYTLPSVSTSFPQRYEVPHPILPPAPSSTPYSFFPLNSQQLPMINWNQPGNPMLAWNPPQPPPLQIANQPHPTNSPAPRGMVTVSEVRGPETETIPEPPGIAPTPQVGVPQVKGVDITASVIHHPPQRGRPITRSQSANVETRRGGRRVRSHSPLPLPALASDDEEFHDTLDFA